MYGTVGQIHCFFWKNSGYEFRINWPLRTGDVAQHLRGIVIFLDSAPRRIIDPLNVTPVTKFASQQCIPCRSVGRAIQGFDEVPSRKGVTFGGFIDSMASDLSRQSRFVSEAVNRIARQRLHTNAAIRFASLVTHRWSQPCKVKV